MATLKNNFSELLLPGLRKVFFETYDELPEQYSKVFHVLSSKKNAETDHNVAGLGMWGEFNGSVPYEDLQDGVDINYTHTTFAKGISIEEEFIEDDLYGIVGENGIGTKRTKALARGARARVETDAANVLNNGFTSAGYDGEYLFDNDHPNYGNAGGTQGNLTTGALADDTLKTARILMRGQTDEAGLKIQAIGNLLVVPPDLEYTAEEIVKSTQKAGVADNDINTLKGKLDVVVMDYLTSSTAWFLVDKNLHQLNFFWRVRPEFRNEPDLDHFRAKFVGRMRFSVGYSDWRGLIGSLGQ